MGLIMIMLLAGAAVALSPVIGGITGTTNGTTQTIYVNWDDVPDGYIFQWDNSGVAENDSYAACSSTWTNTSKVLNVSSVSVDWKVYANDSTGTWFAYPGTFRITINTSSVAFSTDACPTASLALTLLYIFFGLLLIGGFLYCDLKGIGLGLVIDGFMIVFYSIPFYSCHFLWGMLLTIVGLFIGFYAWKLKYY